MGAIAVWIAQHAKQLVAWAAFLVALGIFVVAVVNSGAATSISSSFQAITAAVRHYAQDVSQTLEGFATQIDSVNNGDTYGWARLLFYCLDIGTLSICVTAITAAFGALVAVIMAGMAAASVCGVASWVYVRASALARAISTGLIKLRD